MMKITALILHFNRVFLLAPTVAELRRRLPAGSDIIVADDGSDPRVVDYIQRLGVDGVYAAHPNNARKTESFTIGGGFDLCRDAAALLWLEDDCLPVGPISSIREAATTLLNTPGARMARLWGPATADPRIDADPCKVGWSRVLRSSRTRYTSNQPYMMRPADFQALGLFDRGWIARVEIQLSKASARLWGEGPWAVAPDKPVFVHQGADYSSRTPDAKARMADNLARCLAWIRDHPPAPGSAIAPRVDGLLIKTSPITTLPRATERRTPPVNLRGLGRNTARALARAAARAGDPVIAAKHLEEARQRREKRLERQAALDKAALDVLDGAGRALVAQRAEVCGPCEHRCKPIRGRHSPCKLEGCGGVDLSVGGFSCKAGKWGRVDA